MSRQFVLPVAGTGLFYVLFHLVQIVYREIASPLRHMVGPRNPSLIFGNFQEMTCHGQEDPELTDKWRKEFGANFRFKGLFGISELHTSDLKAINHIMTNYSVYQKAPFDRANSSRLMGNGILSVDLEDHKRFRQISNPAFRVAQMRIITEVFMDKAVQLRDMWVNQVSREHDASRIDVLPWLRLTTLEIIGKAGFNYEFNALSGDGKPNELDQVLAQLFQSPLSGRYATFRTAQSLFPILGLMPLPGKKLFESARRRMYTIGHGILMRSKAALKASDAGKTLSGKRDLLSVLLKANLSADVPENQRLTDQELVSQIPTFFVAGHETTSTAAAWALHALSVNPAIQTKLRDEVLTISTDNPTMDELNSLTYLESVVRETMRIYAPIVFRHRMAMQDDVLPLSKACRDRDGKLHNTLLIPKGQTIYIPILAVNMDKETWGEDALEFKPERWADIPQDVTAIPNVWGNTLTFFAGPHSCIGFRFAVLELKALLFTIIRAFELEPGVAEGGIGRTAGTPQRPIVLAEGKKRSSLPLIVRPYDKQRF
ncbi:cytochrome P450 [Mycena maculata]|uniref:Cytochrome P450 n=1 Tax=Mycena maculata TaxID=230809 RepID=A0AAD7MWK3_9AGAR|nr:cytochrome P450 [Mycena maculata]